MDDDELEEKLREELQKEAEKVEPKPALAKILEKAKGKKK